MEYKYKKITVITGYYGCGKTNLAVNLAVKMKALGRVTLVDMDTVNPYFRTADFKNMLENMGIKVVCPQYANTNLDIPVLNFDLEKFYADTDYLIVDMGGDEAGAYALGRYHGFIEQHPDEYDILYVYSMYRNVEENVENTVNTLREIEKADGIGCTALVNNSNMGAETTAGIYKKSLGFALEVEKLSGLKTAFSCVPEEMAETCSENEMPVKRYVKMIWEK
ncbi:MAG: cobalamin biosynthesis protein CobQ [Oscillospiraceae bacterium]